MTSLLLYREGKNVWYAGAVFSRKVSGCPVVMDIHFLKNTENSWVKKVNKINSALSVTLGI